MFPVIFIAEDQNIYFLFLYKTMKFLRGKKVEVGVWANFWAKEPNSFLLYWEESGKCLYTCSFIFYFLVLCNMLCFLWNVAYCWIQSALKRQFKHLHKNKSSEEIVFLYLNGPLVKPRTWDFYPMQTFSKEWEGGMVKKLKMTFFKFKMVS